MYASENGEESSDDFAGDVKGRMMNWVERRGCGGIRGLGRGGFIDVSEEFEENVNNIANSDQDVQELLDDGYSIMRVRPIIKTKVEANGDVVTKATSAIVVLKKNDDAQTSCASVWVNLEEGKVTKIVISTRTVIEKP